MKPTAILNWIASACAMSCLVLAFIVWVVSLPINSLYSLATMAMLIGLTGVATAGTGVFIGLGAYCVARWRQFPQPDDRLLLVKTSFMVGIASFGLASIAYAVVPRLQASALFHMHIGANFVSLSGATPQDMDFRLENVLGTNTRIDRVELSGIGGTVEAAERTAAILRAHGVHTAVVVDDCESACAVLFELFDHRYVAPNARLGFHDFRGGTPWNRAELKAHAVERLSELGVDDRYASHLFGGSNLTWPSLSALQEHGLISGCWDLGSRSPVECPAGISDERRGI
jgi:hypothetical protein